ncbi:DUF4262 domain-containing protein [Asanoa siamensis]|uniref:DUF4262 domain-containing protein n=1 Tax=Asanoa siamensis TaxID=926357 RepID=A0ABQ4CWY6_9ACTN|nr:DUF4262 domain-containing protein [Asanoa siamensis]GIF75811.1 hypothetical protein Asi02nite_53290 [Asanoa siamensis]
MQDQGCFCVICAGVRRSRDADTIAAVSKHGWCVLRVPGTVEFAYTIGLWHSYQMPEMVMFGLAGDHMQHWLNAAVDRLREIGWPAASVPFTGVIEGHETMLRPVDESWRDALFGTANRFYRGWSVPVWQLVWPDAAGRWPWNDEATVSSRTRQAFGWLPVSAHPRGSWQLVGTYAGSFPLPAEPDSWSLTTRALLAGETTPTLVAFDEGAFDVLDARGYEADDLCLGYLGHAVERHPSLSALADLPAGEVATLTADGAWQRAPLSTPQRTASTAAWQHGQPTRVTD